MKASIILPARNEEQLIISSLSKIHEYVDRKNYSYEILVIVNGTEDKTNSLVKKYIEKTKTKSKIKILNSKAGYGYALRKGLANSKGEFTVVFNVDFFDLKLIDLIDIDLYGRDFIIGSKMAHWSEDKRPFQRKIISYLFNLYLRAAYGFIGSDTHGIKIFKSKVLKAVYPKCKTYTGIFDTEFVLRAQYAGFKIADFPVVLEEKRPPRFVNRLLNTPIDIYRLFKALK